MKKAVLLESVEYTMLQDLAQKSRMKLDQYLKNLIQDIYGKQKR
jgi:hypothetical protein